MTRGFVTIATGKTRYYRIARNLLHSYRLFSAEPMPFALICDRKNRYTAEFDQVVLLRDPARSYLDKLRLPELAPFDETIFIDADCLACRDLRDFWKAFAGASDFSVFGRDCPLEYAHAWFRREDAGEYAGRISSIPDFIGGVYFLRRTPELKAFSETCRHILDHYGEYRFRQFTEPADEPVYALAMAVHGFVTVGERSLPVCFYPQTRRFEANLAEGILRYDSCYFPEMGMREGACMVHWGSGNTRRPVYLLEAWRLNRLYAGRKPGRASEAAVRRILRLYGGLRHVAASLLRLLRIKT